MTPVQFIFILCLLTVFGLYCAFEQARVTELGYKVQQLRVEREQLLRQQRELLCEIGFLSRPERIAQEVSRRELGLIAAEQLTLLTAASGRSPDRHRSLAFAHPNRR